MREHAHGTTSTTLRWPVRIPVDQSGGGRLPTAPAKEFIINAAGKNVSPAHIENVMKAACPLNGGTATIGDRRPYNTAVAVLDAEAAASDAARQGSRTLRRGPRHPASTVD